MHRPGGVWAYGSICHCPSPCLSPCLCLCPYLVPPPLPNPSAARCTSLCFHITQSPQSPPFACSPGAFFYALLPPIVFQAGFAMKKRQFFANSGAILMFAVGGVEWGGVG